MASIKKALRLLTMARICHPVMASFANGIPLGGDIKENFFKMILLDVGLVLAFLDFRLHQIKQWDKLQLVNQGGISEQLVGQLLRTLEPFYKESKLYYWAREQKGASAEVDYLWQHEGQIIPIEVKSGSSGSLKSLHLFMHLKNLTKAVRVNADFPSQVRVEVKLYSGEPVQYLLFSIPFYLVEQLPRLLSSR